MKNSKIKKVSLSIGLSQLMRIMKLSIIILMIAGLNVGATVYSQTMKLNAHMKDVTVKEVFKKIEDQSEFRFFYSDDLNYINKSFPAVNPCYIRVYFWYFAYFCHVTFLFTLCFYHATISLFVFIVLSLLTAINKFITFWFLSESSINRLIVSSTSIDKNSSSCTIMLNKNW